MCVYIYIYIYIYTYTYICLEELFEAATHDGKPTRRITVWRIAVLRSSRVRLLSKGERVASCAASKTRYERGPPPYLYVRLVIERVRTLGPSFTVLEYKRTARPPSLSEVAPVGSLVGRRGAYPRSVFIMRNAATSVLFY